MQSEWPKIALHKVFVTVRQIFSDGPAGGNRAISSHFGGAPFRPLRPPGLAMGYWCDPRLYPNERFNLWWYYHAGNALSSTTEKNQKICAFRQNWGWCTRQKWTIWKLFWKFAEGYDTMDKMLVLARKHLQGKDMRLWLKIFLCLCLTQKSG